MTHRRWTIVATFACLVFIALAFAGADPAPPQPDAASAKVDFVRDIQPILQSACMDCHGEKKPKGRLRLDSRALTMKGGSTGPSIIPGKAKDSLLMHRIRGLNDEDQMPLDRDPLSEQQIKLIEAWIDQGAEWPESASKEDAKIETHWSFVKPAQPAIPRVELGGWARNPIDNFVLARLEKENLQPSPEADKATLIRRLSLDLIGLPPTPEEVDAFLSDTSADAYERLVDRLLASPHYGERWARKWLDLARYADTNGYEKDRPRVIWPYRDWLINALNADMPFDQFTVEQIAGDMLPNATLQQRIATGFHRNTMINEEGGIDPLEYRFHAMVDRVHVTSTAWLGLTIACAQCHTHKYDPISHKEYYSFMAFLDNADEPEMEVPTPDFKAKKAEALAKIEKLTRELPGKFPFDEVRWEAPAVASVAATTNDPIEKLPDNVIHFPTAGPEKDSYTIELDSPPGVDIERIRLEALKHEEKGPGRHSTNDNFVLTNVFVTVTPRDGGDSQVVKLVKATADYNQNGFPPEHAIDDKPNTGWAIDGGGKRNRTVNFQFEKPLSFAQGAKWTVKLDQQFGGHHTLRRFRLSLGQKINDDRPIELRRSEALARAFAAWQEQNAPRAVAWTPLRPDQIESGKPTLTLLDDHSVLASGDFTKSDTYTLTFRNVPANVTAFRLEALTHEALPRKGPGRIYYEGPFGDFFLSEFSAVVGDAPLKFAKAIQSFAAGDNTAQKSIDGDPQSGWSINGKQGQNHYAVFSLAQPLNAGAASAAASSSSPDAAEEIASTPRDEPAAASPEAAELKLRLLSERYYVAALGRFRISVTTDPRALTTPTAVPPDVELALATPPDDRTKDQQDLIFRHWLTITPELNDARKEIDALRNNFPKPITTLVMQERPAKHPRPTPLRHRGEFLQPKDVMQPAIPAVLPQLPPDAPRNRLGLAHWLVSKDNPLTARVVVNRHWDTFFNRGLVRTVEDFGVQGEKPSHPELLDYLAVEFMENGWSMKKLHKLIVTSSTYRQRSSVTPDLLQRDPQNVLLSRAPRYRLDAEILRDAALRSAGLLSTKLGGPSVYPPQHPSITTEGAYGPLPWKVSTGPDRFRRSLYTFAKRTAPFALYANFDAPSGEACTARRDVTNTPLQALSLLNDEVFVEAAQSMGAYLASLPGSDEERIKTLFRRCVARNPDAEELKFLLEFTAKQRERLKTGSLDAPKLAGSTEGDALTRATWTAVARAVMNVDEMVTRN